MGFSAMVFDMKEMDIHSNLKIIRVISFNNDVEKSILSFS